MAKRTKSAEDIGIMDMEDYVEFKNGLVHCDPGAGKTVMCSFAPKLLILAVETTGVVSAKRMGSNAKVKKINRWDDLVEGYEWLRDQLEAGTCPFEWVLIDTVTSAQVKDLRAIMDNVVEANKARDPDIPAIQDHYKWQLTMKRMVTDFNELPINVLWTAQTMRRETDEGETLLLPLIEGKDFQISSWVCAQMDFVWYIKKVRKGKGVDSKIHRRLYRGNHATIECKDRYVNDDFRFQDFDAPQKVLPDILREMSASETGRPSRSPSRKPTAKRSRSKAK